MCNNNKICNNINMYVWNNNVCNDINIIIIIILIVMCNM